MYNPYQFYNSYNNPYMNQPQAQMPILPQQQIIQVNGKASIDTLQLAPNSSLLAMDTSAPIVWMCVSDGIGKVTSTPYDIVVHKDEPPVDVKSIESRVAAVEASVLRLEDKLNDKSNVSKSNTKQNSTSNSNDKGN